MSGDGGGIAGAGGGFGGVAARVVRRSSFGVRWVEFELKPLSHEFWNDRAALSLLPLSLLVGTETILTVFRTVWITSRR
jgi:hypothetical protein